MTATESSIEQLAINTIRTLSMDGVQAANSGHPGTPMALAPVAYQIWTANLRYDPNDPLWPNRDRFVLSCGHASMLIYSLIHLAGVKQVDHHGHLDRSKLAIPIDQIKQFRGTPSRVKRLGSKPPPARWGRGSPTRSAWRSPPGTWGLATTNLGRRSSTTESMRCAATAT